MNINVKSTYHHQVLDMLLHYEQEKILLLLNSALK